MTAEENEQPTPPEAPAAKSGGKRGPKPKAVIEAETEARVRQEMEAEFAEREARLREELTPQQPDIAALVQSKVAEAVANLPQAAQAVATDPTTAQYTTTDPKQITADDVMGDPSQEGSVHIHFRVDGHTALGKVWYIGEELILTPGTPEWDLAQLNDGTGRVFAQLTEDEQYERWDREVFRPGPWRGRSFNLDDPNLEPEERERLRKIAEKRLIRTAAPARN